jgi:acyl-CoA synthetase (AMP-forming)/AMP-acid ligase II
MADWRQWVPYTRGVRDGREVLRGTRPVSKRTIGSLVDERVDENGWMHSGDIGFIRADGHLRLVGRYKDMLKIGGENVDPLEVEAYLGIRQSRRPPWLASPMCA